MLAVITGASKGIGFAIAKTFIQQGFDLAICSRNQKEIEEAAAQLQQINSKACILAMACDLSRKKEVDLFAHKILDTFSAVEILINNTGRYLPGNLLDEPEFQLESLIETNLYSAYHLTRHLLPTMIVQKRGHIFNMSSVAALKAYPMGGSYSISKYALEGFSKNLRSEMMPYGIKVTTINPGATMSDSWKGSGISPERIMKADDIAAVIWSAYQLSPQAVVEEIVLRPLLGDL